MNLKEIVSIAGVPGLHKIIGRSKSGLILESLAAPAKRFASGMHDKVSVLDDISMYTMEGDLRLAEVMVKLNERGDVPTAKESIDVSRKFLVDTIQLDSERVYDSDIKKLLTWFHILKDHLDFSSLLNEEAAGETPAAIEPEPEVKAAPKAPKPSAKNATPKANSKGAAGGKNTYRPKSV